jgi:hypothetical protein
VSDTFFIPQVTATEATQAARNRQIRVRAATVKDVAVSQTIAEVQIDGDDLTMMDDGNDDVIDGGATGAQIAYPTSLRPGDRVLVMFVPPMGAFIIGRLGGDYEDWLIVGFEQNPPFASGWSSAPGTGIVGTDDFAVPMFRRVGRFVELRGRAQRTTDAGALATIFTLPSDYRPANKMSFPALSGPIVSPNGVVVEFTGDVQAIASGYDAPDGYITLDGIIFSVDYFPDSEV